MSDIISSALQFSEARSKDRNLATEAGERKVGPVVWMGVGFAVAFGLALAVLVIKGTNGKSLVVGLQLTARWSFLLLWLAYAGRAVNALFGPAFAPIARRGRELGLAYAAAHLIHVGLVVWFFHISSRPPLSGKLFDFFTIGIIWTYILALFSIPVFADALGPKAWRVLRVAGLNYILFAFAWDFVPSVVRTAAVHNSLLFLVGYVPFAGMCLAAPVLVLAAAAQRHLELRYGGVAVGQAVERG
jgi:hypothetical protein